MIDCTLQGRQNFMNNVINIAFITDQEYFVPTKVAIRSLYENASSEVFYKIYIITDHQMEEACYWIGNKKKNISIITIVATKDNYWKLLGNHAYVSKNALLKFRLPEIIKDVEKILYIDSDTLIMGDLQELFDVDINDKYAAVVRDMNTELSAHPKTLGLDTYFNSGVMLLNLELLRSHKITQQLIDYKLNETSPVFMDQDALNVVLKGSIQYISLKYNYITDIDNKYAEEEIKDFFGDKYSMKSDAVIIHMAGARKPWNDTRSDELSVWTKYISSYEELFFCLKKYFGKIDYLSMLVEDASRKIDEQNKNHETEKNELLQRLENLERRQGIIEEHCNRSIRQIVKRVIIWLKGIKG